VNAESATVEVPVEPISGDLTLRQVLAQALLHNPELASFSLDVRAREAEALQAGLLSNPELEVGVENFGGNGEYTTSDNVETTISLSQLIELGGKRSKRRAAASLDADLAGWGFEAKRLDVLTSTAKAFYTVLAAQNQLEQANQLVSLAEKLFQTVSDRVEAGKVSPVERSRALVELLSVRIAQNRAQLALEAARKELVAHWGVGAVTFDHAVGALEQVVAVPPQDQLLLLLEQNPDLARWTTEADQRTARLALEQSKVFPDLTVGVGIRMFEGSGDEAMVAGISLPFPLFDRNQGGIASARASLDQVRHQRLASRNQLQVALAAGYRDLATAYTESQILQQQSIPAAEQAFEAAEIGYRAGKFGFIEAIDAQRTLFEVKGQYIQALVAYHQARTDVERLVGAPLNDVRAIETKP
jgi:cobalt-zinc-cadmium efflux system outer membrane protein